jgi:DNA repair exonuclease SbcCD ATPase subunit
MSKKIRIKRIKPAIKYVGSLIQQDFGESLIHGMLVWDTKTCSASFVEIENDTCYYTLDINNGKYNPIPKSLVNKKIKLRIKSQNTDVADLKKIIANIKLSFDIEECKVQKINDFVINKSRVHKINIGDVRDIEYQNELICKYLDNKFALDDDMLDGIRHVNRTVNSGMTNTDVSRNITWIPKKFEFSNMFSYGENNVIDFANIRGVCGIFAPNASGKSSMLDAITYCVFDKCGRTSKAASVLNNKSNYFKCKFNFEIDGIDYFIEKTGTKGRSDHVRVDINFYSIDKFNNSISLNGKERSNTNDNIRQLLGTYDDFVLTTLSAQNNNTGFIDMAQRERKDLLAQFLDINIFEDLYSIASNDIKEVSTLIREYQRQDLTTQLAQSINDIVKFNSEYEKHTASRDSLDKNIDVLNKDILKLTSELVSIDSAIEDIDTLNKTQTKLHELSVNLDNADLLKQKELTAISGNIEQLNDKILTYNITDIEAKLVNLTSAKETEKTLLSKIAKVKANISHKLEKMKKLDDLEYDENCSFCMNNIFVKDAIETKASIQKDREEEAELGAQLDSVKQQISELSYANSDKDTYNKLKHTIHSAESKKSSVDVELKQNEVNRQRLEITQNEVAVKINEYHKKESAIKHNKTIKDEISKLDATIRGLKSQLNTINSLILSCHSNVLLAEKTKEKCEESIAKLKELTQQYKYYEYYLMAVSRDGVPYDLITTAVPCIEQEINNILTQLVDFQIMLEMDGKNVNCNIVYDTDNFWPIELTSGMEKFISSLAIRTALINVSSLPRPNFLAIDEGFGTLDSDNLNSMFNMFDYLKTQFSFVLIISHIDSMRDVADKLIEIVKVSGNSNISYV